jgi:hypothetical protein
VEMLLVRPNLPRSIAIGLSTYLDRMWHGQTFSAYSLPDIGSSNRITFFTTGAFS